MDEVIAALVKRYTLWKPPAIKGPEPTPIPGLQVVRLMTAGDLKKNPPPPWHVWLVTETASFRDQAVCEAVAATGFRPTEDDQALEIAEWMIRRHFGSHTRVGFPADGNRFVGQLGGTFRVGLDVETQLLGPERYGDEAAAAERSAIEVLFGDPPTIQIDS